MTMTWTNKIIRFLTRHGRFLVLLLATLFIFTTVVLVLNRKDAHSLYLQAMEEMGMKQHRQALDHLRRIENEFPHWKNMPDVYYQQGVILFYYENNIPGALAAWTHTLELDPNSTHDFAIHSRMAEIYQNIVGDMSKAVEQWRYLVRKYPHRPETDQFRLNIAETYVRTDQFETAIIELKNLYNDVTDLHLKQQIAVKIGMLYNLQKNYPQAREILEEVVNHPHCDACRNRAALALVDTLEAQENYDKAIAILRQIPDNVMAESDRQARIDSIRKKMSNHPAIPR